MGTPKVWPGVLDDQPDAFRPYVTETAFCPEYGVPAVTCCLWREAGDTFWKAGTINFSETGDGDPDGASILFELLVDRSPNAKRRGRPRYTRHPWTSRPSVPCWPSAR